MDAPAAKTLLVHSLALGEKLPALYHTQHANLLCNNVQIYPLWLWDGIIRLKLKGLHRLVLRKDTTASSLQVKHETRVKVLLLLSLCTNETCHCLVSQRLVRDWTELFFEHVPVPVLSPSSSAKSRSAEQSKVTPPFFLALKPFFWTFINIMHGKSSVWCLIIFN